MFCANCGTKQNEGEFFCPNCGTRFEKITLENNIESNLKNNDKDLTDAILFNKENQNSIKDELNIVQTQKEDKYALLWEKININGGELSLVLRENQLDSGIISDVIEEVNIDYECEDVYIC